MSEFDVCDVNIYRKYKKLFLVNVFICPMNSELLRVCGKCVHNTDIGSTLSASKENMPGYNVWSTNRARG